MCARISWGRRARKVVLIGMRYDLLCLCVRRLGAVMLVYMDLVRVTVEWGSMEMIDGFASRLGFMFLLHFLQLQFSFFL
jgi:hypothetical protein